MRSTKSEEIKTQRNIEFYKVSREYGWLGLPLLFFVVVRFVLGFNGLYGQDSHEYLRCANWLTDMMSGNIESTIFFWPVAYPLFGSLLTFTGIKAVFALQIISLLAFTGTLLVSYKTILLIHPAFRQHAKCFVIFIIMPATYYLRAGFLVMSDMQATFFVLSAVYFVLLFLKREKPVLILYAGIMGVLAFFTRYAAGIVLFVPAVILIQQAIKKRRVVMLLTALLICVGLAVLFLFLKGDNYLGLSDHLQIKGWSFMNFFRSSFTTADGYSQNRVINLFYALSVFVHPGYFICGMLLLFFLRRSDFIHSSQMLLLISVIVYLVFIMGMPFQNMRFLLIVFPLVAIWYFPAFIRTFERIKNRNAIKYLVIAGLLIANLSVLIYSGRPFILQNRLEKQIAMVLISKYPSDVALYTFSIDPALRSYGVKNTVNNMWEREYSDFNSGSLLLFNVKKFELQWKDMNPMKNWQNIKQNKQLKLRECFQDGWELYEIQ